MKKLLLLLTVCGISFTANAQVDDSSVAYDENASVYGSRDEQIDSIRLAEREKKVAQQEKDLAMEKKWKRKKYLNIAFVNQTLEHCDHPSMTWKSDFGVSLVKGRTYYLHKKPIAGILKFGIDWTQMDLNYAKYSEDFGEMVDEGQSGGSGGSVSPIYPEFDLDLGCHQFEYSMHVGVSLSINPVDHLMVHGYFRYAPSFTGVILNDEFSGNYGSFFVTGGSISYKAISIGVESRWGKATYKSFGIGDDLKEGLSDGKLSVEDVLSSEKNKMKTNSTRFYIGFRF